MRDVPVLTIAELSAFSQRGSLFRRFGTQNINLAVKPGPLKHQYLNNSSTYNGPTPLVIGLCPIVGQETARRSRCQRASNAR